MLKLITDDALNRLSSNIVCSFEGLSQEQWQQLRKTHYGLDHVTIGGSDVGVLMGVNKYKDLSQLYLEKKGLVDIPVNNEAVEWGNILEPIVAKKFLEKNPLYMVSEFNYLLQHKHDKHSVANIDRLIYDHELDEFGILEVKTASSYVSQEWDYGKIPPSYYAQIQHYFDVTGLTWGYFAVLIGGNRYHQVHVQRNDEYISNMRFQKEMFVDRIELNLAPEITGSESSSRVISHLFPQATTEETKSFDDEYGELLIRRQNLKEQEKMITSDLAEVENKIKHFLGDYKLGSYVVGGMEYKAAYSNVKGRTGFDTKSLQAKFPEIYEQFVTVGNPSRKFTVTVKELG